MDNRWATMARDGFDFGFAVDWMRKDLGLALDEARANGAALPMTALVDQFYAEVQEMGGGRQDTARSSGGCQRWHPRRLGDSGRGTGEVGVRLRVAASGSHFAGRMRALIALAFARHRRRAQIPLADEAAGRQRQRLYDRRRRRRSTLHRAADRSDGRVVKLLQPATSGPSVPTSGSTGRAACCCPA